MSAPQIGIDTHGGPSTRQELLALMTWARDEGADTYEVFGQSHEDREIHAVTFGTGPATGGVLVVGGIHGNEPAGRETALKLIQSMDDPAQWSGIRSASRVTVVPDVNPDGRSRNNRPNAQWLDLNRDFWALQTPEMRALVGLVKRLRPSLVIDLHEVPSDVGPAPTTDSWVLSTDHPMAHASVKAIGGELMGVVQSELQGAGYDSEKYWTEPTSMFSSQVSVAMHSAGLLVETAMVAAFERRVSILSQAVHHALTFYGTRRNAFTTASDASRSYAVSHSGADLVNLRSDRVQSSAQDSIRISGYDVTTTIPEPQTNLFDLGPTPGFVTINHWARGIIGELVDASALAPVATATRVYRTDPTPSTPPVIEDYPGEYYDATASAYGVEASPWSYTLCRTRTGARMAKLEPLDPGSWQRRLGYKGQGSHSFSVSQSATPDRYNETNDQVQLWRDMRPGEVTLIVSYEGQPVYAGLVWKATYSRTSQRIDISHEDVWSLWERRLAIPQHLYDSQTPVIRTVQDYPNLDLSTHAKRVVQMGLIGPRAGLPGYQVPIAFPPDVSGPHRMVHWTYDFATVAQRLAEITEMDTGPQIDFEVEWAGNGGFQWRLVTHYARDERLTLHYSAHDTPVSDLEYVRDLTEYFTEVHVTGEGSETGTLHRRRWLSEGSLGEHRVALGRHDSMGHLKTGPMVQEVTDGLLRERIRATEQIQCSVRVGAGGISPHDLHLGMTIVLRGADDPVIPRGDLERTLIGFAAKGANQLTLELAPPPVAITTVTD